MNIRTKLPNTPESVFAVMTRLANQSGAINLSQGFPDFDPDKELIELVHTKMLQGMNQYAPMPGVQLLRERISSKIKGLYEISVSPENEITITAGATQALSTVISTFTQPGDEVILFEPAYDSYLPSVVANGGIPVPVTLTAPDFSIPWEQVEQLITDKTRMIIINSPHNPTGSLIYKEDFEQLARIVNGKEILVLSDEVYEHIVFDENRHTSILSYRDRIPYQIAVFSFGKVFHATGWKVGYIVAPPMLTAEIRKLHQFVVFAVNTPVQHAYAEYLDNKEHYLSLNAFFQQKRDILLEKLSNSRFSILKTRGTYFQLLDYSSFSEMDDYSFSRLLTTRYKVAVIPLSPFCSSGGRTKIIRVCFAKHNSTIETGAERLLEASLEINE